MNKKVIITSLSILLFLIGGCTSNKNKEEAIVFSSENNSSIDASIEKKGALKDVSSITSEIEESTKESSNATSTKSSDVIINTDEMNDSLSDYSNEQIEYARVWLTVMSGNIANTDYHGPDELNFSKIPAGTPLNPNDDASAVYPVDVVQLAGSRLIDGYVTYKSNENGTITVYDVPLRWEASVPENIDKDNVSEYTQNIINEAYIVNIDPGNAEDVKALIEIENMH